MGELIKERKHKQTAESSGGSLRPRLGRRLRRVSVKEAKKSRRTVCVQRAFAGRPPRDKRAFELEAEKTREARSAPLIAYACRAFLDRSPKQALSDQPGS